MDEQKLKDYFKFDDGDLQANRQGKLSEKQKSNLLKAKKDWKKGNLKYGWELIAAGLVIAVLIIGINGVISFLNDPQPHLDLGALITAFVLFIICGGLGFLLLLAGFKGKTDISEDRVKKADGHINLDAFAVNNSELHVGNKTFEIDEVGIEADGRLANLITQGEVYAVYYDGSDDRILSMELMSKAK